MATSGILFITGYLLINTFFIHQLRYTYHTKDYSIFSWLDSLVTAFAIDGVTSLIQKLYHFILGFINPNFAGLPIINVPGMIIAFSLFIIFGFILFIEVGICKIRYTTLPISRIVKYLVFAKIVVLIASFVSLYASQVIS